MRVLSAAQADPPWSGFTIPRPGWQCCALWRDGSKLGVRYHPAWRGWLMAGVWEARSIAVVVALLGRETLKAMTAQVWPRP